MPADSDSQPPLFAGGHSGGDYSNSKRKQAGLGSLEEAAGADKEKRGSCLPSHKKADFGTEQNCKSKVNT